MSHEEIKMLTQIASVLTVISSLIYFALQIRQNTKMVRIGAERMAMAHEHTGATLGAQTYLTLANDGELAVIVNSGRKNYSALEKVDKLRFNNYMIACFTIWQTGYHSHLKELSDPYIWDGHEQAMKKIIASPGIQVWFERFEGMFSNDFRMYINQMISSTRMLERSANTQESGANT